MNTYKKLLIGLISSLTLSQVFAVSITREQTLCFEDRLANSGVFVDYDANDFCIKCNIAFDDAANGGNPGEISTVCSTIAIGGADSTSLIINPDLGGSLTATVHQNSGEKEVGAGDVVINRTDALSGLTSWNCNVNGSGGNSCSTIPFAVTFDQNHGLTSSGLGLADLFALKNNRLNQTIKSGATNTIIFTLPASAAVIAEYKSYYDAYNISSADTNCDPLGENMGSCNWSTVASHVTTLDYSSLDNANVNKTPPAGPVFDVIPSDGVSGSKPTFSGSRWAISASNSSNVGSYRADNQSGFNAGYPLMRHRRLCEIINVSCPSVGGGGSPAPSCAPGNAPCDYSFCNCHSDETGCDSGDANGDNVCWWDSSSSTCKSADNINNQTDCGNEGFYWNSGSCFGGNGSANTCTSATCTYMGNSSGTAECSGTHVTFGSITIRSHNGTDKIGTSDISFSSAPSWDTTFPNGEIPENGNCGSGGDCQTGLECDYSNWKCVPSP